MKKTIVILNLLIAFAAMSQQSLENAIFKFNNISEFSSQIDNRDLEKEFNFVVSGVNSDMQFELLKKSISDYRGVVSFSLSDLNNSNERTASLKLYKYADHWKYYEFLFSNNGISKILIGDKLYLPSQLENIK